MPARPLAAILASALAFGAAIPPAVAQQIVSVEVPVAAGASAGVAGGGIGPGVDPLQNPIGSLESGLPALSIEGPAVGPQRLSSPEAPIPSSTQRLLLRAAETPSTARPVLPARLSAASGDPIRAPEAAAGRGATATESLEVARAYGDSPQAKGDDASWWRRYWHGGKTDAAVDDQAPTPETGVTPAATGLAPGTPTLREPERQVPSPAAARSFPGWLGGVAAAAAPWLAKAVPWLEGAGYIAGTWVLGKALTKAIDWFGKRAGWHDKTRVVVQRVANLALWTLSAAVGLGLAGFDWRASMGSLGIGTLVISAALKDILGNAIQGMLVLLNHPFDIHEKIRMGSTDYGVMNMGLRYLVLREEPAARGAPKAAPADPDAPPALLLTYEQLAQRRASADAVELKAGGEIALKDGAYEIVDLGRKYAVLRPKSPAAAPAAEAPNHTLKEYTYLAKLPFTIYREPAKSKSWIRLGRPRLAVPASSLTPAAKDKWTWLKVYIPAAAGLAASVPLLLWLDSALRHTLPWLHGGGVLLATWAAAKLVTRLLNRLAKRRHWDPYATVVLRLGSTVLAWAAGLTLAMRVVGVTWVALGASLGVTTIIVSFAVAEVVGTLIQAGYFLLSQQFSIGDRIKSGEFEGTVADMTWRYVVIKQDGDAPLYTFLPYPYINGNDLKIYKEYVKSR